MDPVWRRALSSVLVAAAVTALPAGCTGGRTEQSATRPSVTSLPKAPSDPIESRLIVENTAALRSRLQILGIPARIDLYRPGTHNWPYWQRELHRAWAMLASALGLSSDR
jgi:S-formylglutathione hydrolase FrmB